MRALGVGGNLSLDLNALFVVIAPLRNHQTSHTYYAAILKCLEILQLKWVCSPLQAFYVASSYEDARIWGVDYTCFGLRNAGATFQRLMDDIFSEIPCVVVYIDDLLIFSPSLEQHAKDIKQVLHLLKENGLLVKPDKCIWAKKRWIF